MLALHATINLVLHHATDLQCKSAVMLSCLVVCLLVIDCVDLQCKSALITFALGVALIPAF